MTTSTLWPNGKEKITRYRLVRIFEVIWYAPCSLLALYRYMNHESVDDIVVNN